MTIQRCICYHTKHKKLRKIRKKKTACGQSRRVEKKSIKFTVQEKMREKKKRRICIFCKNACGFELLLLDGKKKLAK